MDEEGDVREEKWAVEMSGSCAIGKRGKNSGNGGI